jgi:hypothetical protein
MDRRLILLNLRLAVALLVTTIMMTVVAFIWALVYLKF